MICLIVSEKALTSNLGRRRVTPSTTSWPQLGKGDLGSSHCSPRYVLELWVEKIKDSVITMKPWTPIYRIQILKNPKRSKVLVNWGVVGRKFTEIKCCVYELNINRDSVTWSPVTTMKRMILRFQDTACKKESGCNGPESEKAQHKHQN